MITNKIEDYIQTITTFEFKVFDKTESDYLYDSTPQQCCDYVWKKYYSSAHFIKMTEFNIAKGLVKHIDRTELKAIVNAHANGHEGDMTEEFARMAKDKVESFKRKNKLE